MVALVLTALVVAVVAAPAAAQESSAGPTLPEAGPTLTVTPNTGLVDHQVVTVGGSGFVPNAWISVFECEGGGHGTEGCSFPDLAWVIADGNGAFSMTVGLDAVLDGLGGPGIDCRTTPGACELRAKPYQAATVSASLDFDPSAPLADPPTLTVTPSTGLVDGQVVQVDALGFRPGSVLFVFVCNGSVPTSRQCPQSYGASDSTGVDDTGAMSAPYRVRAIITVEGGASVDCRTAHCFLSATEAPWRDDFPLVPLEFDPDAPLHPQPTITVTPSTGLVDGQRLHVQGHNWFAGERVELQQCVAGRGEFGCAQVPFRDYLVDDRGEFLADLVVLRTFHDVGGRTVDCAADPCTVRAAWYDPVGFDRSLAAVPLAFVPDPTALPAIPTAIEPRFTG